MHDSSTVVIVGTAVITTQELKGTWMPWNEALQHLRNGTASQVAVVTDPDESAMVFVELDGPDALLIAGGLPAICVRCWDPHALLGKHQWMDRRLSREGVARVMGPVIWRRDPVDGLNALLPIAARRRPRFPMMRRPDC